MGLFSKYGGDDEEVGFGDIWGAVSGFLNKPSTKGAFNPATGRRDELPSVSTMRGTDLSTALRENITNAAAASGWGNVDRGHGLADYVNPNIPANPQFGNVDRTVFNPADLLPAWSGVTSDLPTVDAIDWDAINSRRNSINFGGTVLPSADEQRAAIAAGGDAYSPDVNARIDQIAANQVAADAAGGGSWLDILEDMRLNDPAAYAGVVDEYNALQDDSVTFEPTVDVTQKDPLQESPSMWGPNAQMPDPADEEAWDTMIRGIEREYGGPQEDIYNPVHIPANIGSGRPDGPAGPSGPADPSVPPDFYQPIDLGAQIRSILGEPSTPDYTDDIRQLYADLEQSVRDRSAERTRVLDESVIRREGQLTDIAKALTDTVGPLEAARLLQQEGITADVITRGEGLSADAVTRQEKTRGELGPQVTDEYEQVAELVSGLTGSQATSSADLMSRLESVANMAAAEREAMPGMLKADSLAALGDEEFRIANQIATDLANELGELDPQKAAALLQEKMRQGEFQTEEDMRIANALLGDLQRRTTAVEAAWEQARLEGREDELIADQRLREDELLADQIEREDTLRTEEQAQITLDAEAQADADAKIAALMPNQLRALGIADQFIAPAMQAAEAAMANATAELSRDEALNEYMNTFQQSGIGGPGMLNEFQRMQIEAAVYKIWEIEAEALGAYQDAWANVDLGPYAGGYGPKGPLTNAQYEYIGTWPDGHFVLK